MGILDAPGLTKATASSTYARLAAVANVQAVPVASRAMPSNAGLNTTGYLGGNTRQTHRVGAAVAEISVAYSNFYNNGGVETSGPNNFTVSAAIEYPAGTMIPVFFRGSRTITVEPGATVWSDPIPVSIPADTDFWSRTYATIPTTSSQLPIFGPNVAAYGDAAELSATPTDKTLSGTVGASGFGPNPPSSIRAKFVDPRTLVVAGVGDSITYGKGDEVDASRGWFGMVFNGKACQQRIGFISSTAQNFAAASNRYRRMGLLGGANVAVCAFGRNDLGAGRSLANIQADLQACWASLAARGMAVFQTTITPHVTSTDSYATLANQTPTAAEATRVALNDWIRTKPAGIDGFIELADQAESARNSGKWKVNGSANYGTADGLHPSAAVYAMMATAVDLNVLKAAVR